MPHAVILSTGLPGRFSTLDTSESKVRSFDFTNMLTQPGEAILGAATWSIAVLDGMDAAPNSRLLGSSSTSGNITSQQIGGMLPNVEYMLTATVKTTAGETLTLFAEQYCVPAL